MQAHLTCFYLNLVWSHHLRQHGHAILVAFGVTHRNLAALKVNILHPQARPVGSRTNLVKEFFGLGSICKDRKILVDKGVRNWYSKQQTLL